MIKFIFKVLLILPICLIISCNYSNHDLYETENFAMDTVVSQKIYGTNAKKAANEVFERIKYLERLLTIHAPGGDINRLNENAGQGNIELNQETVAIIKSALKISQLSGGAFDITIAPLVKLWGIGTEDPNIPSQKQVQTLLTLVGYNDIHLDEKNHYVALKKKGQMVDLGGIAKGFAGDAAVKIYKKNGIHSALINLGGNVVTLGRRVDGSLWSIGIQNPRAKVGKYIGIINVTDKTVATSGDYQRYFEQNNKRYHHIIDPKTGEPADSGLLSVTVVAKSSTEADALATAGFVLGLDKGMQLIKEYGQTGAIFITKKKEIMITDNLSDNFIFRDESGEYEFVEKR